MVKNWGDGWRDGPYYKTRGAHQGAVYVVAGSSGVLESGILNHPAMRFSESGLGSLVLDVDGPTLQASFLRETGAIDDSFTIVKIDAQAPPRLLAVHPQPGALQLRWIAKPGAVYQIQWSEDLAQWQVLEAAFRPPDYRATWSTTIDPFVTSGFYRLLESP